MSSNQEENSKSGIHSANSWEKADLGDKSRNEKFLRLMGASKKEHHGRFVIGDQDTNPSHLRPKKDEKHVEEELEEQYKHSMEHRLVGGRKGHTGLGFHEDEEQKEEGKGDGDEDKDAEQTDDKSAEKEVVTDDSKEKDDCEKKEEDLGEKKETNEGKRKSLDEAEAEHEDVKKMKFVKSSS